MKDYNLINQRATTCKHGGHCEWIACDKCSHYEPDVLNQQPCEDCRNCKEWNRCPCGKEGHENGTSIGYSIGECKNYEPCDDCISRQAVLDGLASIAKVKARSDAQKSLMGRIMFFVEQLPPVTPKEEERAVKSLRELTEEYIEEICKEICETRCKYPDIWDEEKEGMALCESDICKFCPLCDL